MARPKKKRGYDGASRKAAAEETRASIIEAARRVFAERGYAGATMPLIAAEAGIALDTVYATVGRKPALLRVLVETSISGAADAIPAEQRDYVRAIRAEPSAEGKLRLYASALRAIQPRLAPVFKVLQSAPREPELDGLWREISNRRAANMRLFAQDLASTGRTRDDLSVDLIADIVWSMNAPEYYLLLVEQRGWTPEQFEAWLVDAWTRLLLTPTRKTRP